jgi:hypothetical protein
MLVFTAKEVFYYCPNGVLMESVSYDDDPCQPLALEMSNCIQLCGHLHKLQADESSTSIAASIASYRSYMELLDHYVQRVLTYDDDVVDAFTGVMNAHSGVSGPFYWGLPQRTFARGLIQGRRSGYYSFQGQICRRPDFPSWSLLGWRTAKPEVGRRVFEIGPYEPQVSLVHIYAYEESSLRLLPGSWDDGTGIEGYCTQSIRHYNKATNLEALPLQPCVEELPPQLVSPLRQIVGPALVFWTHVARFPTKGNLLPERRDPRFRDDASGEVKKLNAQVEVIIINAYPANDKSKWGTDAHLYGIVVERQLGYARRIGITYDMSVSQWLLGNPKKKLIVLI